jgi:hypothetical protein
MNNPFIFTRTLLAGIMLIAGSPALAMESAPSDNGESSSIYDLTDEMHVTYSSSIWEKQNPVDEETRIQWQKEKEQEELNSKLSRAVENNEDEAVASLLAQKADPNYVNFRWGKQFSALHSAAARRHPKIIKMLLDANAEVARTSSLYDPCCTPLLIALLWQVKQHHAFDITLSMQYLLDEITRLTSQEKSDIQQTRFAWLCCSHAMKLPKDIRRLITKKLYADYAIKLQQQLFCAFNKPLGFTREFYKHIYELDVIDVPTARLIEEHLDPEFLIERVHMQTLLPKLEKMETKI